MDDDDGDPFDENGLLKDGRSYRVPMYLRDSAARYANDRRFVATDAQLRDLERAYAEASAFAENAWCAPVECAARVRDTLDINDAALDPSSSNFSLDAARAARDAAYEAYDLWSQNAWRNPG
jgi:hypothetical protein